MPTIAMSAVGQETDAGEVQNCVIILEKGECFSFFSYAFYITDCIKKMASCGSD
jgi:hypothetical protein